MELNLNFLVHNEFNFNKILDQMIVIRTRGALIAVLPTLFFELIPCAPRVLQYMEKLTIIIRRIDLLVETPLVTLSHESVHTTNIKI